MNHANMHIPQKRMICVGLLLTFALSMGSVSALSGLDAGPVAKTISVGAVSGMAVDENTNTLYAVGGTSLYAISASTDAVLKSTTWNTTYILTGVAVDPNTGLVYVAAKLGN